MYAPSKEQAEEDRARAYEANTPHGMGAALARGNNSRGERAGNDKSSSEGRQLQVVQGRWRRTVPCAVCRSPLEV